MVKELDGNTYLHMTRLEAQRPPYEPVLFLVSRELFEEVEAATTEADTLKSLENAGYQNRIYNGVPVIWSTEVKGRDVVTIQLGMLDGLRPMAAKATA